MRKKNEVKKMAKTYSFSAILLIQSVLQVLYLRYSISFSISNLLTKIHKMSSGLTLILAGTLWGEG